MLLTPLPVFSTLLLLPRKNRRRQTFQIAAWELATVGGVGFLLWFASMRDLPPIQVWGLWGYVVLAPVVLMVEVTRVQRSGRLLYS